MARDLMDVAIDCSEIREVRAVIDRAGANLYTGGDLRTSEANLVRSLSPRRCPATDGYGGSRAHSVGRYAPFEAGTRRRRRDYAPSPGVLARLLTPRDTDVPTVPRTDVAVQIAGVAHGLDDRAALAQIVLRALALYAGAPPRPPRPPPKSSLNAALRGLR